MLLWTLQRKYSLPDMSEDLIMRQVLPPKHEKVMGCEYIVKIRTNTFQKGCEKKWTQQSDLSFN